MAYINLPICGEGIQVNLKGVEIVILISSRDYISNEPLGNDIKIGFKASANVGLAIITKLFAKIF